MSRQMTSVYPSTPTRLPQAPSAPATPVTGTWRHPKMDEIIRRQNAASFTDRNIITILYNLGGMTVVYSIGRSIWKYFPSLHNQDHFLQPYASWTYYLLHAVMLYNIALALYPLARSPDPVEDIPLTPGQRKLFGLPPSSRAATPDAQYSTPPKYKRTPIMNHSPVGRGSNANSPLSGKGPGNGIESDLAGSFFGSSYGPSSPLVQKAMGDGSGGYRRRSYGSASPLGGSTPKFMAEAPGSPSPSPARNPSVGLNSKWLYDKERRNSGSARLYT
ncbi:hypothetical protein HYFRA_00003734 [Hymenoscyphus fraxineus]|uniref:Nuclear pore complex component n=1 Tax=Hymenoscyphus fraxineus TaxID=746836 RepID=A0A9N9L1A9_9HELO|nr:hypothetical protein HYFRA_00003734 [Hymenoscyphus fraxineus]